MLNEVEKYSNSYLFIVDYFHIDDRFFAFFIHLAKDSKCELRFDTLALMIWLQIQRISLSIFKNKCAYFVSTELR